MGYLLLIIYNLLTPLLAPAYLIFFILSPRRSLLKNFFTEIKERLSVSAGTGSGPLRPGAIWLHAASVGEVTALSRLVPELRSAFADRDIVITTSSWAGRAQALKLSPAARLAPLDFYPLTKRFLGNTAPCALLLIETEIWPNMLFSAAQAGVPVFMINARISENTLALYRAFAPLSRVIFSGVRKVSAQSRWDADRFSRLPGLEGKVAETGNLKYDLLGEGASDLSEVSAFLKACGWENSAVLTAGSTHPLEEPVVIDAWLEAKRRSPGLKLIIAPRHAERLSETENSLRGRSVSFSRWSAGPALGADCLLVDAMGLLRAFYAVSTICFAGGTLDDTGGHNLLEPALFSKPVLFGPNFRNARLAGETLLGEKAGFMVKTAPEMAATIANLLNDPAQLAAASKNAGKTLCSLKGATRKTLDILKAGIGGR